MRLVWMMLWLVWVGACDWQPIARPVQPEQLLKGDYQIVSLLDQASFRYVLVVRTEADARRYVIADLEKQKFCELPENTADVRLILAPPSDADLDVTPIFKLAFLGSDGDGGRQLYTSDPDCTVAGPFGDAPGDNGDGPYNMPLLEPDLRSVVMWRSSDKTLLYLDPWTSEQHVIAPNVGDFSRVQRLPDDDSPQKLWLLEEGKLVQRTFLGEFVLSIGKNVTSYKQAVVLNSVRVVYREEGNLNEAASPMFEPFRLDDDACSPVYSGTTLNYYKPCADEQLIRIDLSTGIKEEFAENVAWSYIDKGVLFELTLDEDETPQLYVTLEGRLRTEIVPFLNRYVEVLDSTHIAGRSVDKRFGVWNPDTGFETLYEGVVEITPFIDTRSGSFVWLMAHELDDDTGLATLSVFDQSDYEVTNLAKRVPVNRYSWEQLETVGEPVIVTVEKAEKNAEGVVDGELRARLLSGELGSSIDTHVTSYRMIALPLPGLLYTVSDEARKGLWFAAL